MTDQKLGSVTPSRCGRPRWLRSCLSLKPNPKQPARHLPSNPDDLDAWYLPDDRRPTGADLVAAAALWLMFLSGLVLELASK